MTEEPPVILRGHDCDPIDAMTQAMPLYSNLYTMWKYNGEGLTTYQPGVCAIRRIGPIPVKERIQMQPVAAQTILGCLHALLNKSGRSIPEGFQIRHNMYVDDMCTAQR